MSDINVPGNNTIDIDVDRGDKQIDVNVEHSTGTANYEALYNKPQIESVTLQGNKTFRQLGLEAATVQEVEALLYLD